MTAEERTGPPLRRRRRRERVALRHRQALDLAALAFRGRWEPVALVERLVADGGLDAVDAEALAGTADPARARKLDRLAGGHLPQGAPSSPAVSNVIAHHHVAGDRRLRVTEHLDVRLAGLARSLGAVYTRYADDLAFSGPQELPLHRLLPGVRRIVIDEGFRLRDSKTSIAGAYQRQKVAGLVVKLRALFDRVDWRSSPDRAHGEE